MFARIASAILLFASIANANSNFTCLGSDAANITFSNHAQSVLVPDLWTVRIMQGGYSSQTALNYAAYMFMREKLGIDVSFYPAASHDGYWGYYGWVDSNGTCPDSYECCYPECYWYWLDADYMDLEFEYWPTQEEAGDAFSYYAKGSVVDGFTGVFGEMGFYLPKYFVDAYPTSVVPHVLKTNDTIRELLRLGSMNGGTKNWTQIYSASKRPPASFTSAYANYTTNFDVATGSMPIIWGSSEGYSMTQYAYDITHAYLGGLGFEFVTTMSSGESGLLELVSDLYSNRVPFIANVYVPDDNFAVTDPITGELQEFERVAFPRNPDQSTTDECYVNKSCQYPIEPLKKAANTNLTARFPEAYEFFQGFSMKATQVAQVINYYRKVDEMNTSLSIHEKWLNASCEWLKDSASVDTWNNSQWLVDIVRYDCLPGCGAPNDNGDYVGGTCNYFNPNNDPNGTCDCDYDEIWGERCTQSCDGLTGPLINASMLGNGTYVNTSTKEHWYYEFCSGHGTCDIEARKCDCDDGYGDNGCGTKYETYVFPVGVAATIMTFSLILAIVAIGCVVWLRLNAQYKTVKALSVDMTTLFSIGLICLCFSNVVLVIEVSSASCILWQLFFGLGGILSIMSPLLKAYRVSRVFHGGKMLRAVKITDKMLLRTFLKAAVLEFSICIVYAVMHEIFGGTEIYYNDDELRTEAQCNQNPITTYISLGSYAYFFIMLCALCKYSYGTRRALSVFKESTCAYSSSLLSMFCTLITFGFYTATNDPTFRNSVQAIAVIIVVGAVLFLFYATRIYTFFNEPENRNVTDMRSPTYTASSTANYGNNSPGPVATPAATTTDGNTDTNNAV